MIKKILTILFLLATVGYLVYALFLFSGNSSEVKCQDVQIEIRDDSGQSFVQASDVRRLLRNRDIRLIGKKMGDINYEAVEKALISHRLIERAECYGSPSGTICINIWQHLPILRVAGVNGNYYIDSKGKKTGLSNNSAADVVVASGYIKDSVTVRDLYRFAVILRSEPLWDSMVEQIYVESDGEWIIIPRVGDFEIEFGQPVNMETKMKRAEVFIRDYLPKMGWDRYSKISLKFDNQIVCTKKE